MQRRAPLARWLSGFLANRLASLMARAHGGRWIACVDHNAGFVLIRPRNGRAGEPRTP